MNMKAFLLGAVCSTLVGIQAHAASIFPQVVDPPGQYDEVVDTFIGAGSTGAGFNVKGTYRQDAAGGGFSGFTRQPDTLLGLYSATQIDGVALPAGKYMAVIISVDMASSLGAGFPSDSAVQTVRAGYDIGSVLSGHLGAYGAGSISGASAALITSETVNFASLLASDLDTVGDFTSTFSGADIFVEALLGLDAADGGGGFGTFGLEFQFSVLEHQMTPTNFLPVSLSGSNLSGTSDFAIGSGGTLGGTSLAVPSVTAGGESALTGGAIGAVNPIPEPASMLTLLGCVGGACVMGRRRRKAAAAA